MRAFFFLFFFSFSGDRFVRPFRPQSLRNFKRQRPAKTLHKCNCTNVRRSHGFVLFVLANGRDPKSGRLYFRPPKGKS